MRPTSRLLLVGIAVLTAVVGYTGGLILEGRGRALPDVPPSAPAVLLLFGAIVLTLAVTTRSRLRALRERRADAVPLNPLTVARYGVLARASSPVGAGVFGLYGGYALFHVVDLGEPGRGELATWSGLAALAGLGLTLAALFLEHVCRIPDDRGQGGLPHPRANRPA